MMRLMAPALALAAMAWSTAAAAAPMATGTPGKSPTVEAGDVADAARAAAGGASTRALRVAGVYRFCREQIREVATSFR